MKEVEVLCYNCGVKYKVPMGTENITGQCKECKD